MQFVNPTGPASTQGEILLAVLVVSSYCGFLPPNTLTNEGHAQIKKQRIVALSTRLAAACSHQSGGGHFSYSHIMFPSRLAALVSLSVSFCFKQREGRVSCSVEATPLQTRKALRVELEPEAWRAPLKPTAELTVSFSSFLFFFGGDYRFSIRMNHSDSFYLCKVWPPT